MLIVQSAASAAAVSAAQERSSKAAARRTSIGRVQAQLPKSACMSTPLRQAPFRHAGVASRSQHRAAGDAWAGYKGVSRKSAKVSNSASPGAATAADPSPGLIGSFRAKLAEKVAADPNFIFKLFVEILIDELITITVNVLTRGSPFSWSAAVWAQVLCQLFVALFNDIALVWALAPAKDGKIAHCFQEGAFSVADRLRCWFDKWKLYTVIGFFTGLLSMVATGVISGDALLLGRVNLSKAAITGALHLGISANSRYQIVNGLEVLIYKFLPSGLARGGSTLVRMANNFAGARLWMVAAAIVAGFF